MAETPSAPPPPPPTSSSSDFWWCHHCNKRVSIETLPDIACLDCKNGFVESIPAIPDHVDVDDPSLGSQFLQIIRLIAQAAREEDTPLPASPTRRPDGDDFLGLHLDGSWDNDDEGDGDNDDEGDGDNEEEDGGDDEGIGNDGQSHEVEVPSDDDDNEDEEEDLLRRRRDAIRLQIQDISTRARTGRNRILDWAEILMGLEDNSIEFRLQVPQSDHYIGNPEDYVDAAEYEVLLQNLAESGESGRRGPPPAAKSAVAELPKLEIMSDAESVLCAICKDMVTVGEMATKLPCGHGYHGDCIVPWLDSRNSCPVCRFELPTDDPEYEEERKKKAVVSGGGASGSGVPELC